MRMALGSADGCLLGFTGCCLVLLAVELLWPHPLISRMTPLEPDGIVSEPLSEVWQPSALADYQLIADRPLFTIDRRPYEPPYEEVITPPEPVGPPVEFELVALITTEATRMALLKTSLSPEVHKLSVDQAVEGWTLIEVLTNAVLLENEAEVRTVELQPTRPAAPLARGTPMRAP